jgi:hypothetical protein
MPDKRCFTYCGDDRCDCEANPTFSGSPTMSEAIGPRPLPQRLSCEDCPALKTEWWVDEIDSGTNAYCMAAEDRHISVYWSNRLAPPERCPALGAQP